MNRPAFLLPPLLLLLLSSLSCSPFSGDEMDNGERVKEIVYRIHKLEKRYFRINHAYLEEGDWVKRVVPEGDVRVDIYTGFFEGRPEILIEGRKGGVVFLILEDGSIVKGEVRSFVEDFPEEGA